VFEAEFIQQSLLVDLSISLDSVAGVEFHNRQLSDACLKLKQASFIKRSVGCGKTIQRKQACGLKN